MSERRTTILLVTLIALVAVGGAYFAGSHRPGRDPAVRGIVTNGSGSVTAVPDQVRFQITISRRSQNSVEAMNRATASVKDVIRAATAKGVARKDITTTTVRVGPTSRYEKGTRIPTGFESVQGLSILVRELDDAGPVISAVAAAVPNVARIDQVSMEVGNRGKFLAEARAKAVRDAKKAAAALADAAGKDVGKVLYVEEQSDPSGYEPDYKNLSLDSATASAASAEIPLQPGEQKVRVRVKVRWAIG